MLPLPSVGSIPIHKNASGNIKARFGERDVYKLFEKYYLEPNFGKNWRYTGDTPIKFNGYNIKPDYRAWKDGIPYFFEVKNWDVKWEDVAQSMKYIITLDRMLGYQKYAISVSVGTISKRREKILKDMGAKIILHKNYLPSVGDGVVKWM